jgi:uncharacterized protein (DUF2062 family)
MKFNIKKKIRSWYIKLVKFKGSPDSVARGVAIGFFIGFLIPIGFQMVFAWLLAWLLKAKKIPALACTWITNHVTVIVIYPVQCYVGSLIMGQNLSYTEIKDILKDLIENRSWEAFSNLGSDIIIPFMVGGALFGIISGVISYFTAYGMILSYRNRVEARIKKRLAVQAVWRANLEEKAAGSAAASSRPAPLPPEQREKN